MSQQPISLSEFRKAAYSAYQWTSFDPDKRAASTLTEHEAQLNEDLKQIPETEHERYISNYKKYFGAWLAARGNCASSMITGPANFNIRRNEKANNLEHKRYGELMQWRDRALAAIKRHVEEARPQEEKDAEAWESLERTLRSSASTIEGINNGTERGYNKALFVSSIYNKVETYAKRGDTEMVARAVALIEELNQSSRIISARHKFFKLPELAAVNKQKQEDNQNRENTGVDFIGGRAVNNFAENRLQLIFDEKPSSDIIAALKRNAFKWSPNAGAWQRQLTGNAVYAAKSLLKEFGLWLLKEKQ